MRDRDEDEYGYDPYYDDWDELDDYDPDDEWKPPELTPEERRKREQWAWEHLLTEEERNDRKALAEVFSLGGKVWATTK